MNSISERMIQLIVNIANFKTIEARSKTAQVLKEEFNIGTSQGKQKYTYNMSDRQNANQWCEKWGINPTTYNSSQLSRSELGLQRVSEKKSSLTIFNQFACIKPLNGCPKINGIPLLVPNKSHLNVRPQDVQKIEANALLVVENLETFVEQLDCKNVTALLPEDTLAIFRGSPQFGGNMELLAKSWSHKFSLPRIGFYDYDLSGLIKASEQNFTSIILPIRQHIEQINLKGNSEDFFRQENEIFSKFSGKTPAWLKLHSTFFQSRGGSFTQERLIAHGVEFYLHPLEGITHE